MTSVTGVMTTLTGVVADVSRGVMDRFRSMPMARLAVPFGQTGADTATGALSLAIMAGMGLAVGWRAHRGAADTAAAFALLILFQYAVTWTGAFLGLLVKNEATADNLVPLVFPVTMVSNAFVPASGMPPWLRATADWNPVSAVVAACRSLFGNPGVPAAGTAWPLEHPVIATLSWSALLLAAFMPLAAYRFGVMGR
jgi:ABC-2 type transport system permease protein